MGAIAGMIGSPDRALLDRMVRRLGASGREVEVQDAAPLGPTAMGGTCLRRADVEVAFDGRIANRRALCDELRELGHACLGAPDAEVLLHAHEAWGPRCISTLEGSFALAISEGDNLLLARDYFGNKPLHYFLSDDRRRLLFASDAKALLEDPTVPRRMNMAALFDLCVLDIVLPERSFLGGIHQVPPGGTLKAVRSPDGTLDVRLGRRDGLRPAELPPEEDPLIDHILAQLSASIDQQLDGDQPVGVYLSSGIDSTLVATLAARGRRGPLHTFTFADAPTNRDLGISKQVAAFLGTDHHEILLSAERMVEHLPQGICITESPIRFSNLIKATASLVRQEVEVALSGEGADESFANHPDFRRPREELQKKLSLYNELISSGQIHRSACANSKAILSSLLACGVDEALREQLYALRGDDQLPFKVWERGAAASELMLGFPFIDRRLCEIALAVPWNLRVHAGKGKYLLRRAVSRLLPAPLAEVVLNQPKVGMPSALVRSRALLTRVAERLLPEEHVAAHPCRVLVPKRRDLVLIDLFVYLFVVGGGSVPDGFTIEALYTRHLDDLRSALHHNIAHEEGMKP
jgi:asparagine synthase (glutamine-hydrolysing)